MSDEEITQDEIDAVVPERWRGTALADLPAGLRNLVRRRHRPPPPEPQDT